MRRDFLARLAGTEADAKSWRLYKPKHTGKAPRPYAGNLIVLVDRRCGSACESFVMYARQLPTSLVVGENTAGVGVFGETRRYRLPRSGIWLQAGRKWFHDPDPTRVAKEGFGYQPDIWLNGADPRAAALQVARCVKQKTCSAKLRTQLAFGKRGRQAQGATDNPRAHVVLEPGVSAERVRRRPHTPKRSAGSGKLRAVSWRGSCESRGLRP